MAVTPVRTGPSPTTSFPSPSTKVVCPTSTPRTSVMALRSLGVPSKGTPRSRARGTPVATKAAASKPVPQQNATIAAPKVKMIRERRFITEQTEYYRLPNEFVIFSHWIYSIAFVATDGQLPIRNRAHNRLYLINGIAALVLVSHCGRIHF